MCLKALNSCQLLDFSVLGVRYSERLLLPSRLLLEGRLGVLFFPLPLTAKCYLCSRYGQSEGAQVADALTASAS